MAKTMTTEPQPDESAKPQEPRPPEETRHELRAQVARERELINRVGNALAAQDYTTLRDLADELVRVAARQAELRQALAEAQARGRAQAQERKPAERRESDVEATWRLLR